VTRQRAVVIHDAGGRTRVEPRSELDLDTRESLAAAVGRVAVPQARIDIDLRRLAFIDSAGLTTLIEIDRDVTARSGTPPRFLVAESGPVRRMIELTLLHLSLDVRVG
jgi:anti-anti-sigma factor